MAGLGPRLLEVAQGQVRALEDGDVASFERLADQRDALVATLARAPLMQIDQHDRAVMAQVVQLDREAMGLAARLLDQTDRERRQLRHGRAALRGYARPGADLASRPAFLDRAS